MGILLTLILAILKAIFRNLPAILLSGAATTYFNMRNIKLAKGVCSSPIGFNSLILIAIGAAVVLIAQQYHPSGSGLVFILGKIKGFLTGLKAKWDSIPSA